MGQQVQRPANTPFGRLAAGQFKKLPPDGIRDLDTPRPSRSRLALERSLKALACEASAHPGDGAQTHSKSSRDFPIREVVSVAVSQQKDTGVDLLARRTRRGKHPFQGG